MKKIFTITLLLAAFATANAQTHTTAHHTAKKATKALKINNATAAREDNLSKYVGTNDASIALIREGVRKG